MNEEDPSATALPRCRRRRRRRRRRKVYSKLTQSTRRTPSATALPRRRRKEDPKARVVNF